MRYFAYYAPLLLVCILYTTGKYIEYNIYISNKELKLIMKPDKNAQRHWYSV